MAGGLAPCLDGDNHRTATATPSATTPAAAATATKATATHNMQHAKANTKKKETYNMPKESEKKRLEIGKHHFHRQLGTGFLSSKFIFDPWFVSHHGLPISPHLEANQKAGHPKTVLHSGIRDS